MYMSGHPDTLVAYAKWYGKVKEAVSSAEMTAIDTKVCFLSSIAWLTLTSVPILEYDIDVYSQKRGKERSIHSN